MQPPSPAIAGHETDPKRTGIAPYPGQLPPSAAVNVARKPRKPNGFHLKFCRLDLSPPATKFDNQGSYRFRRIVKQSPEYFGNANPRARFIVAARIKAVSTRPARIYGSDKSGISEAYEDCGLACEDGIDEPSRSSSPPRNPSHPHFTCQSSACSVFILRPSETLAPSHCGRSSITTTPFPLRLLLQNHSESVFLHPFASAFDCAVKQWKQLKHLKRLASRSLSVRGLDCTVGYGAFLLRIEEGFEN
ncbi:hypothetical protein L3X38_011443 [Prunus dulcis]|uniref:Uncharacterized protein n=1 Tax=Prunus dulcis TaxID=3755 RepID=A0AAD4ZEB7_PRUDU|nr:hypothetical protein L3X38_011443 [Prunus dulcis]